MDLLIFLIVSKYVIELRVGKGLIFQAFIFLAYKSKLIRLFPLIKNNT